jgi:hypothetical protein
MMYIDFVTTPHTKEQSVDIPRSDQAGSLKQERFSPVRQARQ